jgi:hypothetical protein
MKLLSRSALLAGAIALPLLPGCQSATFEPFPPALLGSADLTSGSQPPGPDAYGAEGLRQAFAQLCQRLSYRALRVEIDQSERPFLVYGILEGRCDYREIRDALNQQPGYTYVGSVTKVHGGGARTLFALNMTPHAVAKSEGRQDLARLRALVDTLP